MSELISPPSPQELQFVRALQPPRRNVLQHELHYYDYCDTDSAFLHLPTLSWS